jgi:hypothetical protein
MLILLMIIYGAVIYMGLCQIFYTNDLEKKIKAQKKKKIKGGRDERIGIERTPV